MKIDYFSEEPTATLFSLERWGSRSFWYWYTAYKNIPEKGLDGTETAANGDICYLTQTLNGTNFCVAAKIVYDGEKLCEISGKHRVDCRMKSNKRLSVLLYYTVCVGESVAVAKEKAFEKVNAAAYIGRDKMYSEHCEQWRSFWERSFVSLPKKFDYIENLWYLNLYYAGSEMRGKSPAHFCNGIWCFYHDFVPWSSIFHYNSQLATFPPDAANHSELLETYCDFRYNQLPKACEYSKTVLKTKGAFYSDTCDCIGRNLNILDVNTNCTCGAQIAVMLYRHYRFIGDENFLNEKVIPVMKAVGEFYLDKLILESDGYYHIHKTQGYEGSSLMDDSITDLSMIRILFGLLIDLVPSDEGERYIERYEKLVPFTDVSFDDDEIKNGKLVFGIGKGKTPFCDKVLSVGRECESGKLLRNTFGNYKKASYGFPDTEMSPLFPAGIVGLKDKDSELFKMICNSVYLHCETIPDSLADNCMGWCMMPIYMARLGMAKELEKQLKQSVDTWFIFPQGFGMYGPYSIAGKYNENRWVLPLILKAVQ